MVMNKKIAHVTKGRVHLMGDSRGILTPYEKRNEVYSWAITNNIVIEYHGSLYRKDLWYVKNDKDRVWFALRWS